jgi:hypothetical protein
MCGEPLGVGIGKRKRGRKGEVIKAHVYTYEKIIIKPS